MALATETAAAVDAIKDRFAPALDTLDETMRQGRRAYVRGRHAAEDAATTAALTIRRRPLAAVMIGAGAGALAGAVIGFAFGRLARCGD
jgi:ElaB/YqjD/DUF883 family membrane-anchored ribosome-binding protein